MLKLFQYYLFDYDFLLMYSFLVIFIRTKLLNIYGFRLQKKDLQVLFAPE